MRAATPTLPTLSIPHTDLSAPQALIGYVLKHMAVRTNLCSLQTHEHRYSLQRRTVHDYNFIFVTRGCVVWVVDGVEYPLHPGGLVIVPPGIEHHAYSRTRRITLVSTHVECTLPGGQDVFELLVPPRYQHVPRNCALDRYIRGAALEYQRAQAETTQLLPLWSPLICNELFRHCAQRSTLHYRTTDPFIAGMLEDIGRRIAEPVTLAQLAQRSGFSAQHLNRVFQRTLGVTPLQYLARTRMERAAELLREGRLTVGAVAAAVGFDDPYYFSRQFSQHFGVSPSRFIQTAGSDSPSPGSVGPFRKQRRKRKVRPS